MYGGVIMIYLFIVLILALFGFLVRYFFRDRKELKKKTVETIGDDLWKEIEEEREENLEKGIMFRKALRDAFTKDIKK